MFIDTVFTAEVIKFDARFDLKKDFIFDGPNGSQ